MDQFMVDVSHIKEAAIGDTVTIFGKDGEKNIPVEEIAEKSHSFKIVNPLIFFITSSLFRNSNLSRTQS